MLPTWSKDKRKAFEAWIERSGWKGVKTREILTELLARSLPSAAIFWRLIERKPTRKTCPISVDRHASRNPTCFLSTSLRFYLLSDNLSLFLSFFPVLQPIFPSPFFMLAYIGFLLFDLSGLYRSSKNEDTVGLSKFSSAHWISSVIAVDVFRLPIV